MWGYGTGTMEGFVAVPHLKPHTNTQTLLCVVQTPDTGTGFHLCFHGMSRVRVRLGTAALCRSVCATVPDAGVLVLWHMVVDAFGPGESIMAWDSGLGRNADGRSSSPSLSPLAWLAERDISASPGSGCAECGEPR